MGCCPSTAAGTSHRTNGVNPGAGHLGFIRTGSFIALETEQRNPPHGNRAYEPLPAEFVGIHSNHGIKPRGIGTGAVAKINQDRGVISYPFAQSSDQLLVGVYDGHGPHGERISEHVSFEVVETLEANPLEITPGSTEDDPPKALRRAIVAVDEALKAKHNVPSFESGTTACVALVRAQRVWVACVGDSRAVKATRSPSGNSWFAHDLSVDQKADNPEEQERIIRFGGYVSPASAALGPARVWQGGYGIGPGLAMGRSIGDHAVSEYGVISEPVIEESPLSEEDECLVVASDGVWEFMSSQEAIDIVFRFKHDASDACKALIEEATLRWRRREGNYRDDITAMVVLLPILDKLNPKRLSAANGMSRDRIMTVSANGADGEKMTSVEMVDVEGSKSPRSPSREIASGESPMDVAKMQSGTFVERRLSTLNTAETSSD